MHVFKHQRLRTQYQSTTHQLLIHPPFTGTKFETNFDNFQPLGLRHMQIFSIFHPFVASAAISASAMCSAEIAKHNKWLGRLMPTNTLLQWALAESLI